MSQRQFLQHLARGTGLAVLLATGVALAADAAPARTQSATDQGTTAQAQAENPAAVVAAFNAKLLDVMKNAKDLGYEGRYKELAPVIKARFDIPVIARYSVGSHWKDFSADQRKAFIAALRKLSIGTYAERFDGYSGQHFKQVGELSRGGRQIVRTALVKPGGESVTLDYVLQQDHGQWKIVNVIAKGVSDLATKRSQYTSVIRRQGIPALIKMAQKKAAAKGAGDS